MTGSDAPAGAGSSFRVEIPLASRSSFWQQTLSHAVNSYSTTVDTQENLNAGEWMQQAAVTSVTVLSFNSSVAAGIEAGSHFEVWGDVGTGGGSELLTTCRLTRTESYFIDATEYVTMGWDQEREDTNDLHSLVSNPDRITVAESGLYTIEGRFRYRRRSGTPAGQHIWTGFFLNGATVIDSEDWYSVGPANEAPTPDSEAQFSMVATHRLAAGDYLNVQIANECDGQIELVCDAGVVSGDNQTCEFIVTRLGG